MNGGKNSVPLGSPSLEYHSLKYPLAPKAQDMSGELCGATLRRLQAWFAWVRVTFSDFPKQQSVDPQFVPTPNEWKVWAEVPAGSNAQFEMGLQKDSGSFVSFCAESNEIMFYSNQWKFSEERQLVCQFSRCSWSRSRHTSAGTASSQFSLHFLHFSSAPVPSPSLRMPTPPWLNDNGMMELMNVNGNQAALCKSLTPPEIHASAPPTFGMLAQNWWCVGGSAQSRRHDVKAGAAAGFLWCFFSTDPHFTEKGLENLGHCSMSRHIFCVFTGFFLHFWRAGMLASTPLRARVVFGFRLGHPRPGWGLAPE
jgi:hypothetical protein